MNVIHGQIVLSARERDMALQGLEDDILGLLESPIPAAEITINACDALAQTIGEKHIALLEGLGLPRVKAAEYIREAKYLLKRETLIHRLKTELGDEHTRFFYQGKVAVREILLPLGTLFHIAAGNQYGLAFYSVIEGLLTGNINLVKLPGDDDGLSAMILTALFEIEPALANYVYLFDYTSKETAALQKLMGLADAVVIWGGDASIQAVRRMAEPNTKIIEWGHKLSFAYITPKGMGEAMLEGLAENIVQTNQLLCSSCQGIFLDTASMEDVHDFCALFLPILERCAAKYGAGIPLEIQAQTGLRVYTKNLLGAERPCRVFQGKQASLLAYEDALLEPAIPYQNPWVKRLPRKELLSTLRPYKGHLQTAALLCAEADREGLTQLLWRAGAIRVTGGENMSRTYGGAAHDGEYTLRRYTRLATQEMAAEGP